ncbi:MAG: arylesterase [Proteobacteria bacterium]|nr:MAG: arylesterase [Pseudomonadota bacterium]
MKPSNALIYLQMIVCITLLNVLHTASASATNSKLETQTILVWGDSLSAAYGIAIEKGWVNLLQERLNTLKPEQFKLVNGSISGETTHGGLTRLPKALTDFQPDYVLLELGANDGLRGMSPQLMHKNLQAMLEQILAIDAKPVLIGIKLPPNYGAAYNTRFEKVYVDLAEQYELPIVPFLLEGVAEDFDLMQADGLHPTAEAQPIILEHVWKTLSEVLGMQDAVRDLPN